MRAHERGSPHHYSIARADRDKGAAVSVRRDMEISGDVLAEQRDGRGVDNDRNWTRTDWFDRLAVVVDRKHRSLETWH
jgi:hypothetical protein